MCGVGVAHFGEEVADFGEKVADFGEKVADFGERPFWKCLSEAVLRAGVASSYPNYPSYPKGS